MERRRGRQQLADGRQLGHRPGRGGWGQLRRRRQTHALNNFGIGTSFTLISFAANATGFTLSGNALNLTSGATAISDNANANTQTFNIPITFTTAAPTITTASNGVLVIQGAMNNGGFLITANVGAGAMSFDRVISNTDGLTKTGVGILTLSGSNTYTGKTTVSQGTLSINSINNGGGVPCALGQPAAGANSVIALGGGANAGTLVYTWWSVYHRQGG